MSGCKWPEHHGGGGGGVELPPIKTVAILLLLAAAGGAARVVHPHFAVPWKLLAFCGVLAGCGLLSLGAAVFARWERRRQVARLRAEQPVALRWRSGEPMREPKVRS